MELGTANPDASNYRGDFRENVGFALPAMRSRIFVEASSLEFRKKVILLCENPDVTTAPHREVHLVIILDCGSLLALSTFCHHTSNDTGSTKSHLSVTEDCLSKDLDRAIGPILQCHEVYSLSLAY